MTTDSAVLPYSERVWWPTVERCQRSQIASYLAWLAQHGYTFTDHNELWSWSVTEPDSFWTSIVRFFDLDIKFPPVHVGGESLVETTWFPNATTNYAEVALRRDHTGVAAIELGEEGLVGTVSFDELRRRTATVAGALKQAGLRAGNRIAAVLPNGIDALVLFLACARVGAVWCCLSPELGDLALEVRLRTLQPTLLFVTGPYTYAGREHMPTERIARLAAGIDSIVSVVQLGREAPLPDGVLAWDSFAAGADGLPDFRRVPFSHPLWVLFTSGTTGPPKGIVHGHGGIVLEHVKLNALHFDLSPSDRFMWLTSSGWVAWNLLVSGLLVGSTVVLYNGSPNADDGRHVWRLLKDYQVTALGLSPAFLESCRARRIVPRSLMGRAALRTVITSGSPLSTRMSHWIADTIGDDIYVSNVSGGTEFATILLGAVPSQPIRPGRLQYRALGVSVDVYDGAGRPTGISRPGELVVTRPLPSMPLGLLGDRDGTTLAERYLSRYEGVWHHGDMAEFDDDGSAVIHGRSDGTLKRGGVRIGVAEYYEEIVAWHELVDALVVDLPGTDGNGEIVMFAEMEHGTNLTDELVERFCCRIEQHLSPRHVPDRIIAIPRVPKNANGKRLEVPVKHLLLGQPDALAELVEADPEVAEYLSALAASPKDA